MVLRLSEVGALVVGKVGIEWERESSGELRYLIGSHRILKLANLGLELDEIK